MVWGSVSMQRERQVGKILGSETREHSKTGYKCYTAVAHTELHENEGKCFGIQKYPPVIH